VSISPKDKVGVKTLPGCSGVRNWTAALPWYSGAGTPVLFLSTPTKLKTEAEETRGPNGDRKGEKTCNFQGCPKTKLFSDAKCPELFFFTYKKIMP